MPEYTISAAIGAALVVLVELVWFRTGLFRTRAYWISMAIVFSFQILVDGWLTKLSAPIVLYTDSQFLGVRFPWDIPVEDFLFGFAMITLTMLIWDVSGRRRRTLEES